MSKPWHLARIALAGLAVATIAATSVSPAFAERDHDRDHWRWREHGWHEYYQRPNVYYSAPPVVYPPYGYYAQPGVSLNFSFPIR